MRYALIGCGRIASNHIKAALACGLEICAVCDIRPQQMEALLEKHGLAQRPDIRRFTDYREMIEQMQPELAAIATESGVHAEIALCCIHHRVDIIVEKPLAMSMQDADAIVSAAREEGVKVCACHQNRFNLAVQQTRRALDEGRFGRLSHGSIHVRWNRNKAYYDQAAWRGTWAQDGGCLMNQCIHGIDLLRWLMGGRVTEVFGATRRRFHDYIEAEDVGLAVLKFADGSIATVEGTTNTYRKNLEETLFLFGEKGLVKIGGVATNTVDVWDFEDSQDGDATVRAINEDSPNVYGNGHLSVYRDVIEAIEHNRAPYIDASAGRDALEIVLAIYKSSQEGRPIMLPLRDCACTDFHF